MTDSHKLPLAFAGMKIGLMGGSFNPAHQGHRHISEVGLKRARLDRVWWLLTPGNPLKDNTELAPLDRRFAAAAAIANHPSIRLTTFEAARGLHYSVDTIHYLRRRLPGVDFIWMMGADNLAGFHHWRHWRKIAQMLPILVVDRPGARLAALNAPAAQALARYRIDEADARRLPGRQPPAWCFLTGPLSPLSSTEIRAKRMKK